MDVQEKNFHGDLVVSTELESGQQYVKIENVILEVSSATIITK